MTEQSPPEEAPNNGQAESYQELLAQLDETRTKLKYALAETENMRKRLIQEKQEMVNFAVENTILDFLEPIDNFENALSFSDQMSEETRSWAVGFQMILGQLKNVLGQLGVNAFHSVGKQFDSSLHYALEAEATDQAAPGTILQELSKGYSHRGKTLRHAKVKVATAKEKVDSSTETKE